MSSSPKISMTNDTSSTAHGGVRAKEIEIANARLDMDECSGSSRLPADSPRRCDTELGACATPRAAPSDLGSYVQVIVEKHRRKREQAAAAAQTSARLPAASSPTRGAGGQGGWRGGGDGAVLWAAPLLAAAHVCVCSRCGAAAAGAAGAGSGTATGKRAGAADCEEKRPSPLEQEQYTFLPEKRNKKWKIFTDISAENLLDDGPDRVEVYRFERCGGAYLATSGGSPPPAACERAARRAARLAAAALTELLAVPRLLLALPVGLLLHVQRCLLVSVRGLAMGCVQTASDYALKPALAVTFNALVQPLLVFARNVAESAREALRPAALALADAVEPAARLLAAARLVEVHPAPRPASYCSCSCARAPDPAPRL